MKQRGEMNNKRSLWIFNHYAVPPEMPGGTRHFDLAKEFLKKGYEVTIFASSYCYGKRKEDKLKKGETFREEQVDGVRFIWLKTSPYKRNDWRRVLNIFSYMRRAIWIGIKLKEKPDVTVGSSVHPLAVLAAYILAKIKKAKFIFEVRDLWPQTLIELGNYKKNNPFIIFMRLLEKFLYIKAKKIIVLLPKASEYITKLGIPDEKIAWIPNGVDMTRFKERDNGDITDNLIILMYIGAHGRANSLDVILDAASIIQEKTVKEIKIKFIGDGPEKESLIKKAHDLNIKIVQFCAPVPKNRIPEIMQEASGFIFPLEDAPVFKYGISSNKLWDYMASGKPVIFSCNSINNPVEEAEAGLTVPAKNPQRLAEAIIKIYKMPAKEREKIGRRGRKYVEKYHNIEKLADKFLEVIS